MAELINTGLAFLLQTSIATQNVCCCYYFKYLNNLNAGVETMNCSTLLI
jgi:hypothetical protein